MVERLYPWARVELPVNKRAGYWPLLVPWSKRFDILCNIKCTSNATVYWWTLPVYFLILNGLSLKMHICTKSPSSIFFKLKKIIIKIQIEIMFLTKLRIVWSLLFKINLNCIWHKCIFTVYFITKTKNKAFW